MVFKSTFCCQNKIEKKTQYRMCIRFSLRGRFFLAQSFFFWFGFCFIKCAYVLNSHSTKQLQRTENYLQLFGINTNSKKELFGLHHVCKCECDAISVDFVNESLGQTLWCLQMYLKLFRTKQYEMMTIVIGFFFHCVATAVFSSVEREFDFRCLISIHWEFFFLFVLFRLVNHR